MTTTPGATAHRTDLAPHDNRLTYDDDLFQRSRRVLGISLVNQTVWRFDEPIDVDRLEQLRRGLARGPLGRVVTRSRIPAARDRWVPSSLAPPVQVEQRTLAPDEVLAWADRRAETRLDPDSGPTWELSTAATSDGGSVLSYLTTHVVCDGGAHIASLVAAAEGTDIGRLPVGDDRVTLGDDLRDARTQLGRALRGAVLALRTPRDRVVPGDAQTSTQTSRRPDRDGDERPYRPTTVVVDCPSRQWDEAARRHGGTSNTLLVAVVVEVLLASGRAEAGRPVRVALPVSLRGERDLRSNATSGVSIDVDTAVEDGTGRVTDLGTIRSRCRAEFSALADGSRHDPLAPLKPLMQMLPDRAVALLARGAAAPLCLCSNLGDLPAAFAAPTRVPATSVLMRSVTQDVTPSMMRRTRGGVSAWWSRHGDTVTLGVLGMDPDHFDDAGELARLLVDTCARWGVDARAW